MNYGFVTIGLVVCLACACGGESSDDSTSTDTAQGTTSTGSSSGSGPSTGATTEDSPSSSGGSSGTTEGTDTQTDDTDTDTDTDTGGVQTCAEACGEVACLEPEDDCLGHDPICIPPASKACQSCMTDFCDDVLSQHDQCGEVTCLDFAVTVRNCGDATPYAPEPVLDCIADFCAEPCVAAEPWSGCVCE